MATMSQQFKDQLASTNIKPGKRVKIDHPLIRDVLKGTVVQMKPTIKGLWAEVNLGDKKNPVLKSFRVGHMKMF